MQSIRAHLTPMKVPEISNNKAPSSYHDHDYNLKVFKGPLIPNLYRPQEQLRFPPHYIINEHELSQTS